MLITIFFIFSFNGGANGLSVAELKELVAAQLTEAFDRIIQIEKGSAKEIKELKSKDLNNTEEINFLKIQVEDLKKNNVQETEIRIRNTKQIEFLKTQVQELQKLNAPATCSDLWKQGITRSQEIYLDSDGFNHGEKPVRASCTFPSNNVTFGEENHVNITHCEGADCFQSEPFQIDSSTLNQMQSVIEASTSCSQKWLFNCKSAPLKEPVSLVFTYIHLPA